MDLVEMISPDDKTGESTVFVTRGNMTNLLNRGWFEKPKKSTTKSKEKIDGESQGQ